MSLPTDFVASATALECYELCPRRFRYRYLDHLPAAGPAPGVVRRAQRGDLFHRLVVWDALGLDTSTIIAAADDPELPELWASFQTFRDTMRQNGTIFQHDRTLTARCGSYAVQAKLDALAFEPTGAVTIFDWKTSARPDRARLTGSAQSKVYPYVVRESMRDRPPERIQLVYWFAADPGNPLRIDIDAGRLADASGWLGTILYTISTDDRFDMTTDRTICATCEYLAHCGVRPQDGGEWEVDEDYYQAEVEDDEPLEYDPVWS